MNPAGAHPQSPAREPMLPLEVLQLIGYSLGALLPLWMGALLLRRPGRRGKLETTLLALGAGIGLWHTTNLFVTLQSLLGFDEQRWATLLRLSDSVQVISITLSYSLLLHVHLHLWAQAHRRPLRRSEQLRIYCSYLPAVFLLVTVPLIWIGPYAPMFEKLSLFVLPFSIWAAYVLAFIAATDLLISRMVDSAVERRIMQTLAASFVGIGLLVLLAIGLGVGEGTPFGPYLKTLANLGSVLPTALIAYYIYRYRYLELMIKKSLVMASFAVVVLALYLYVIRNLDAYLTARYRLREGVVESLLILGLALFAGPLRGWLEQRFRRLFEREAALYREVVTRIGARAGQYKELGDLLAFIEERTTEALGLRGVTILAHGGAAGAGGDAAKGNSSRENGSSDESSRAKELLDAAAARGWQPIEGGPLLAARGYAMAFPLRREDRTVGVMLIDAPAEMLTEDVRAVLGVLAGQVAMAIEDCRLVEENLRLERQLAQRERLAALGQMAATVAHEVKNPLSAIKSIAQVMREDDGLGREYSRDLELIVGETDRLNRSVTQLLSFARSEPAPAASSRSDELVRSVTELFRAEATRRGVAFQHRGRTQLELEGALASALRDGLSNLVLNALQATETGGAITIEERVEGEHLVVAVVDTGTGIPTELRERIWEPFFTTKQRGTGLGLAIVRKRMEEIGGTVRLLPGPGDNPGTGFELRIPTAASLERQDA